jgi:hypothetical protein
MTQTPCLGWEPVEELGSYLVLKTSMLAYVQAFDAFTIFESSPFLTRGDAHGSVDISS